LALLAYAFGYRRALAVSGGRNYALHSRPVYYGAYVAAWAGIPSILLVLLWLLFQERVIDWLLLATLPTENTESLSSGQTNLLLAEIKQVARGNIFGEPDAAILVAAETNNRWLGIAQLAMVAASVSLALVAAALAARRISPDFRARQAVERILDGIMIVCSLIAILTTAGIVLSLLYETARFFSLVPVHEFLLGLNWEPQIALRADQSLSGGGFGAIPVFVGTLQIAFLAMLVAIPIGLFTAIYLTQYAGRRFRVIVKPVIEMLAGIPTVVYGFFAVLVVAPALRD